MSEEATSSGCPTPKTDGEGDDVEEGVTMLDVLQDEEALEDDANAVLGSVSDTSCTYPLGYLSRQPIYSCSTCSEPDESSGVCLACSYHCHEGHNLMELYTKRMFRCDCGSSKLQSSCKLEPKKEENKDNNYNQNFRGLYCTCSRPYPDPEDPVSDCMIQCVVCEDWFHGRHTGEGPPSDSSYAEMICAGCVANLPFLQYYSGLAVVKVDKEDIKTDEAECNVAQEVVDSNSVDKIEAVDIKNGSTADAGHVSKVCLLSKPAPTQLLKTSLFLPMGWRSSLCKCSSCLKLYSDTKTTFLTEENDTVHHYESQSREKKGTMEQGMEALSQMDRVRQVEAIQSYNDMKENLMEYLAKFANNKKVVREDDIKTFFEEMKGNKKRKTGGGPPPNCK